MKHQSEPVAVRETLPAERQNATDSEAVIAAAADESARENGKPEAQTRSGAAGVLAFLAICYTLYFARDILFPIFLSLILYLLLRPPVRWLVKQGMWDSAAAALVILPAVSAAGLGVMQLWQPAEHWVATAPHQLAEAERKLRSLSRAIDEISKATRPLEKITTSPNPDAVPVEVQRPKLANTLFGFTSSFLTNTVLTVVTLFFLLASGDKYLNKILSAIPTFRGKRGVVEVFREIERGISTYLFTFTIINIALGVVIGVAMWLIGLPNPALWGVMATTFNFVPYLGPGLGIAVVGMVGLLEFDSLSYATVAPLVYLGVCTLEGQIITPMILGRSMSMNPLMILLSIVFWGWIWGIGGALLAVPLLAVGKIFCDRFEKLQPLGNFLGG